MSSVAVFVDAGYLFAQGSAAMAGAKVTRSELILDPAVVMAELIAVARDCAVSLPLLRVYWYDGARSNIGLSPDHAALANTNYLKLRLGFVNRQGEQKGVDSLIVTDLIELARNRAISDAVLLSGDEDVRVGVQIAQSFGIRVHLLGIVPSRGSQSRQLMQEADTTREWDEQTIRRFLTIKRPIQTQDVMAPATPTDGLPDAAPFNAVIELLVTSLTDAEILYLRAHWQTNHDVPRDFDGKLLARCRAGIDRDLTTDEKRLVRKRFQLRVGPA